MLQTLQAQKSLPSLDRLAQINDSIVQEAMQLYMAERISWIATDVFLETHQTSELGGSLVYQPSDSVWVAIFVDREHENCINELRVNGYTGQGVRSDTIRPLTTRERNGIEQRHQMIAKAFSQYGDSIRLASPDFGSPNIDIIPIHENLIRMYILQGTVRPHVIPFGNDYSVDFDNHGEIKAFRAYHRSLLAMDTVMGENEKVESITHSHLKNNPFITPTDICNFLLYGGELRLFSVFSTAYGCTFTYLADTNQIVTATNADLKDLQHE